MRVEKGSLSKEDEMKIKYAWKNASELGPVKSKKRIIFKIIISIILLIIIFIGIYFYFLLRPVDLVEPRFSTENAGIITEQDFSNYLESHPAIQDLPEDSYIELNLGEGGYLISEEQVLIQELGDLESDIDVTIPEEYLSMVEEVGLCQTIGEITKEGDFEIDTNLSTFELINKYKGLLKYKDCLEV
jgi:hypothetical protein